MTTKRMFLTLALLSLAAPARAFFFNSGLKQISGNNDYYGTSAYAHFGSDIHFKPSFSSFHSNVSGGTFNAYALRVGYDMKLFGAGVTAGTTPKVNGYKNSFVGVDASVSLTPTGSGPIKRIKGSDQGGGAARGKGLARVDVGAGVLHTSHSDDLNASGATRTGTFKLGQTDLSASVGVSFLENLISLDLTKSVYDKTLSAATDRGSRVQTVTGLTSMIQGFPKTSASARLEMSMIPVVSPFVSYTRTTFELSQPSLNAYALGGSVELMILEVVASYQHYTQAGVPDNDYVGLGASLRF